MDADEIDSLMRTTVTGRERVLLVRCETPDEAAEVALTASRARAVSGLEVFARMYDVDEGFDFGPPRGLLPEVFDGPRGR